MIKRLVAGSILTAMTAALTLTANPVTLTLEKAVSKAVSGSWEGGDIGSSSGGNGTMTLEESVAKTAILKVKCNAQAGYTVRFAATNATSDTAGKLLLGGVGGSASEELTYTATLDLTDFTSTASVDTNNLQLQTAADSVAVNFNGGSDVIPLTDVLANNVKLVVTLDSFTDSEKESGTYSETITATVTVR